MIAKRLLVFAALCGLVGIGMGYDALGRHEEAAALEVENAQVRARVEQLRADLAEVQAVEELAPVKYMDQALSTFVTSSVEAGEILGAGVRVGSRTAMSGGPIHFPAAELKYQLRVASVELEATSPLNTAPAVLALIEEELRTLPVTIRHARAERMHEIVRLKLEVDVFGR
jgi:hypothetical protein